mgnify:CR=1 FL=1
MLTEQEQEDLREIVDKGRRAKIVFDFITEYLINERARVMRSLEIDTYTKSDELLEPVIYLRLMRRFENSIKTQIDAGDLAEKELREDGN